MSTATVGAPVIALSQIRREFPGPPAIEALSGVDLEVSGGEFVAVVGPSGSGKSTLLNVIGLLDRPSSGSYQLDGVITTTLRERDLTALRGRRIGFVFQDFHLLPHRSAVDNVALGQLYTNSQHAVRRAAAIAALRRVGLENRIYATPTTLSGGERQRVAIARALAGDPAVLLCDEPTGNLDSANAQQILDLLDELHTAGTTLVVITHDPVTAARAGRRLTLVDGRITADQVTPPVATTPNVVTDVVTDVVTTRSAVIA